MNQTKGLNGVNTLLLALILVVHTWIGISVANLAVYSATAPSAPPEDEHLSRTLASLDRLAARLHPAAVDGTLRGEPTNAEFANDHSLAEAASAPQTSVGIRENLPISRSPDRTTAEPQRPERYYYDLAERIAPKAAADNLRGIHVRLRGSGEAERRTARRSILLMTRTMVLERFGKPSNISLTRTGHESWYWNSEHERLLSIVFRDGYAISVN